VQHIAEYPVISVVECLIQLNRATETLFHPAARGTAWTNDPDRFRWRTAMTFIKLIFKLLKLEVVLRSS
jgi:hypothetical protein